MQALFRLSIRHICLTNMRRALGIAAAALGLGISATAAATAGIIGGNVITGGAGSVAVI